tara:strand:- start:1521 stop:1736 length:216 start_codon:yes stop_codon:yes gene_type:complete
LDNNTEINDNHPNEKWLMYKHITDLTTFNRNQIWKWVREGEFPKPFKFGRKTLFKESEVKKWMADRARGAA